MAGDLDDHARARVGTMINQKYRIDQLTGSGETASVYLAARGNRRSRPPRSAGLMRERPSRTVARRSVMLAILTSVCALSACSQQQQQTTPGQIVVAIDTDMALPDQIDNIEVQVSVEGTTLLDYLMPVGAGVDTQPIPATLTLVAGPDPAVPATVRVLGWKNGLARTLRQAVTTVPSDRVATLRMPVQWLCDGTAVPVAGSDGGTVYQSQCGPDFTCQAGQCVPSKVMPATLADYDAGAVFGGGAAPLGKGETTGTCFDTIACLVAGMLEVPDDQCTVAMPAGAGANVNVGLRVANDGICDTTGTTCFVPLDGDSDEGWTAQNGRIALPPPVCTKLRTGLVVGVVVSTSCPTKTDADPPCGPWSSVSLAMDAAPASVAPDATLPTPTLVSTLAPAGGQTVACCPLMADSHALYTCLCDGSDAGSPPQVMSIDPSSGDSKLVASFTPMHARAQYETVFVDNGGEGEVYWIDRTASGDAGETCPVNYTPVAASGALEGGAGTLAVVNGDVYDQADLLADATNLYALADNVSGLAPGAYPVQLMRIDRMSGAVTPFDTTGATPVLQFTQDASSIYVGVDTDVSLGDAGVERISRIIQLPKAGGAATTIATHTLTTSDPNHGGFIGLQDDGTSLFALYEQSPAADGTVDTQVTRIDSSDAASSVLYEEQVDSSVARLRLLGAVNGAVVVVRDVTKDTEAGAPESESAVIIIPSGGETPRIAASFQADTPIFGLQTPAFTSDSFWLNASGRVFRLPAAALQ
jgi:hypothetical protein